ncbi:hypothetical protein CUT44_29815 [Streptomyces carminius]|uniref:PPC domain-containing protein n=1 Tax=Streptomyces carminius TaxID=2665496 RepID=A0A2M8LR63_9ACTN|nr:DUF296 domain-containing protein [Streptomyces carminius]PJE94429.1 hypothetical protein CUT44_29815 [Streptomyces carminius]
MHTTLQNSGPQRDYTVVFDPGEEVVQGLADFARQEELGPASFAAIGGFHGVEIGFYNIDTRGFDHIPFPYDQAEVLSLIGDISPGEDGPTVHGHVVLGCPDGAARGGHLLRGTIRPILIVTVEEMSHAVPSHH